MKIHQEEKQKLEEYIKDFIDIHSKRNIDHHEFSKYVFTILEQNSEGEDINIENCAKLVEDFFGSKSNKFIVDIIELIKFKSCSDKGNKSSFDENSHSPKIEEENEENHNLNIAEEEEEEASEDRNIFKAKRYKSDDDESDEDNPDRGHKRRKSSREKSSEKESSNKNEGSENPSNLESKNKSATNKYKTPPGFPFPPFPPMNLNMMKGQNGKKFPKNMMKGPFPPMFPFPYPPGMPQYYPPPIGFPDYFQAQKMWSNANPNPAKSKLNKPSSNEYDPLNPSSATKKERVAKNENPQQLNEERSNSPVPPQNLSKDKFSPKRKNNVTRDTIYIKNIPNYYNTVETLSKYYKKFGSIETINVEQNKLLASIKFMKPLDAVKAFNSNTKLFGKDDIFVTLNQDEEPTMKKENPLKKEQNLVRKDQIDNKFAKSMNPIIKNNNNTPFSNENINTTAGVGVVNKPQTPKKEMKKSNSLLEGKLAKHNEIKIKKEREEMRGLILKKLTNKLKFLLFLKNRFNENQKLKEEIIQSINDMKNYKEEVVKGKYDENLKEVYEKELHDFSYDFTLLIKNAPEDLMKYASLQNKMQKYGKIENMKILLKENCAHIKYATFENSENAFKNVTDLIVEYLDPNLVHFIKAEEEAKNQEKKKEETKVDAQIQEQIRENEETIEITKQMLVPDRDAVEL